MPEQILNNEFLKFMTKIIIPATITTAVAIAIDVKNNISKVSWLTIFMSMIIGLGGAYLAGDYIMENLHGGQVTLAVSAVTMLTEKTFKFVIHKFEFDKFIARMFNLFLGTELKDEK